MKKFCNTCKIEKNSSCFTRNGNNLYSKCKECRKKYTEDNKIEIIRKRKLFYLKNKETICSKMKEYYEKNKETIKQKELIRYHKSDKQKINKRKNEYSKLRKKIDPSFKLSCLLRNRLVNFLKGTRVYGSFVRDLGCDLDFLKSYIEQLFKPGMSWDNWSKDGWHLDHIKPLCAFNLTDRNQFLEACHYTNLQPLWAKENLRKSKKWMK